jgi:RNA polymerase sigma-70 factor (ECF subfamily)
LIFSAFARTSVPLEPSVHPPSGHPPSERPPALRYDFAEVYDEMFPFVWRTLRRLGVEASAQDDACQEVFVIVHRKLPDFRGESSLKTWVFGVTSHVVRGYRRTLRRKEPANRTSELRVDPEELSAPTAANPHEILARNQMARVAEDLINTIEEEKRVMLILADLEGIPVTEIAELHNMNVNTAYARLRAARKEFSEAVSRYHARTSGGRNE